jgi:hypothetical protein
MTSDAPLACFEPSSGHLCFRFIASDKSLARVSDHRKREVDPHVNVVELDARVARQVLSQSDLGFARLEAIYNGAGDQLETVDARPAFPDLKNQRAIRIDKGPKLEAEPYVRR